MQIIRECQFRAAILTELAKTSEPERASKLLYLAGKWLVVAGLRKRQLEAEGVGTRGQGQQSKHQ
jgi:hypothetical protein